MALNLYFPALLVAFVITLLEMTEVVVLVVAVSADHPSARPGATGAVLGVTGVALVALLVGVSITLVRPLYLLVVSGVLLAAFGVFLFRSTLRTYRRAALPPSQTPPPKFAGAVQFGTGATAGAVEAVETVVVLLGITAAGYGWSAVAGALLAGGILVVLAFAIHEQLRKVKVPWLKLVATSMLFTFSVFWFGEAVGIAWPYGDLFLIPLFGAALLVVRGTLQLGLGAARVPTAS